MKFDESQLNAIDKAVEGKLTLITGGAGCGKTTIIKAIADQLDRHGEQVAIAAFAGKAAARIREATGYEASTIHRLLRWQGEQFALPDLNGVTVIIDEASMVDSKLMAEIMKRKPRRLVLVGDEAQLPPVGSGQPFHDLIRLKPNLVANLTTCYRATEAIFRAATLIRNGQQPVREETTAQEHWLMTYAAGDKEVDAAILSMVRCGDLDCEKDIILAPRNGDEATGSAAVAPLNAKIAEIVNPRQPGDPKIIPGDRVICTKNNPELDIWNGTTATVMAKDNSGRMQIRTDTEIIGKNGEKTRDCDVPADFSKNFQLAYALTVHKSQGSQYRKVIVIVLQRDAYALLSRPLIYTAVTRAKRECHVIGELRTFANAIMQQTNIQTILQQFARIHQH